MCFISGKNNIYFDFTLENYSFGVPLKAKNKDVLIYTKENFEEPPNLCVVTDSLIGYCCPKYGDSLF